MIERSILQILLDKVVLSPENSDSLVWRPKKSGEFSVKSFSMELAKSYHNGQNGIIKGVWNGLVPHRIEIFTWLTLIRKINTKAKLASLGIIPPNQSTCILCDQEVEILDHLFLHCIMARKIWQWWLEIWNVKGAFPSSLRSMYDQWLPPTPLKGKFFFKNMGRYLLHHCVVYLEGKKHENFFYQKSSTPTAIQYLVLTH